MGVDGGADGWQAPARAPVEAADDDLTVIRRSRSDPERFAVLVRRHGPAVGRYVTRRIGQERAEDVVAETFLVAFRKRAGYQDQGRDCLPWLYGIATRLMHRERRNEVRQLRLLAVSGTDPVTAPFTDRVEDAVAARGVKQRLAAAMAGPGDCVPGKPGEVQFWYPVSSLCATGAFLMNGKLTTFSDRADSVDPKHFSCHGTMSYPTYRFLQALPTDPPALLRLIRQTDGEQGLYWEFFTICCTAGRRLRSPPRCTGPPPSFPA